MNNIQLYYSILIIKKINNAFQLHVKWNENKNEQNRKIPKKISNTHLCGKQNNKQINLRRQLIYERVTCWQQEPKTKTKNLDIFFFSKLNNWNAEFTKFKPN